MRFLTVTAEEAARFKREDEEQNYIEDEDGYTKLRWFEEHGPGAFLVYCCGEAAIPKGLSPTHLMDPGEQDEAYEILIKLAESLPKGCNCDGEYIDGRLHGRLCLAHRAEQLIDQVDARQEQTK